jgi:hypothetical protein
MKSVVDAGRVTWLAFAVAASAACAVAVATGTATLALAVCVAVVAASFLPRLDAGVIVGVLLVMANNALLGVNLVNVSVSGAVNGTDLAFAALLGVALLRHFSRPAALAKSTPTTVISIWSVIFLTLWGTDFIRALDAGSTYLQALSVGRDYLYFGLTLPFAKSLIQTEGELRHLLIVAGGLSLLFACADIGATLDVVPHSIANAQLTQQHGSLTRIYNTGYYLFELALSMSVAYALLTRGRRARMALLFALVTALALALTLTRALYVGVSLAVVLTFALWLPGRGFTHRILRQRLIATAVACVALGAILFLAAPARLTSGATATVVSRAISVSTAFTSSNTEASTIAFRQRIESHMLQVLGSRWPAGLGFLAPQTNYFVDLPKGEIRDVDLGLFNSLMTMGVIGAVILYLPPLWLLFALFRRARAAGDRYSPLWLGGTIWLLIALITSYTLGSFASVSGLATVAVGSGVLLSWLDRSPSPEPTPRSAEPRAAWHVGLGASPAS